MDRTQRNIIIKVMVELENRGLDLSAHYSRSGGTLSELFNPSYEFKEPDMECIWEIGVKQLKDKELGFSLGLSFTAETLGILGMIIQNSQTVKATLNNAVQFIILLTDMLVVDISYQIESFVIKFTPDTAKSIQYPYRSAQVSLLALALCSKLYKLLTLRELKVNEISLPKHIGETKLINSYFKSTINTNSTNDYSISINNECLDHKVLYSDVQALSILTEYARTLLENKKSLWSKKVEGLLIDNYSGFFLSLEDVAIQLNLSTRSLQRKLSNENSTFQEIKNSVRIYLAKHYLNNGKSTKYVAHILGYSNTSSFSKAFVRWTNTTISSYLQTLKE